jgi:hypothetical protein
MANGGSLLAKLLVWIVVGFLAIAAIKLALGLFGIVLGLGAILLFTVGPLILIGWLVVKAWDYLKGNEAAY